MSDVSSYLCKPVLEAIEAAGESVEALVEGLPLELEQLRAPRQRIPWDDFTEVLDRAGRVLPRETLVEIGRAHVGGPVSATIRALLSRVIDMRTVYRIGAWRVGPAFFPTTRATHEDLPDGRIRQTIEIVEPYRCSETFFHVMQGSLERSPVLIGIPDARVEMVRRERKAIYTIELPGRHGLPQRLRRMIPWRRRSMERAFEELHAQQSSLRESYDRLERAQADLETQRARVETLNQLGRELARHTSVSDLADAVIALVTSRFGYRGVALLYLDPEGGDVLAGQGGELSVGDTKSFGLELAGRSVGRLDVSGPSRPEHPLGDGVLSWIALALNNALAFDELARQSERLRQETADRQRVEQQLHQAQKLEAVGVLAGGLAHDFNNLLTAIGCYATLAIDESEPDSPVRESLQEIQIAGERGAALITQLMAFTRRQILRPQAVDLNGRIRRLQPMLERLVGESATLVVRLAPDLAAIHFDPSQLEQVLINLIVNSRDATRRRGTIEVETQRLDGFCRLVVRDDGEGMSPETRARVFEPFFSTKPAGRGTGLGLSTVYGIVTQSGGRVSIESEPGQGTAVSVDLPLADVAEAALEPQSASARPRGKERVLVVDDDDQIRVVTCRMLAAAGYTVIDAANALDAIEVLRASGEAVDLVVTDVVMPDRDGRELARELLRLRPEIRGVVYTSGYATEEIERYGALPPESPFLRKPFGNDELLLAVRSALDRR